MRRTRHKGVNALGKGTRRGSGRLGMGTQAGGSRSEDLTPFCSLSKDWVLCHQRAQGLVYKTSGVLSLCVSVSCTRLGGVGASA